VVHPVEASTASTGSLQTSRATVDPVVSSLDLAVFFLDYILAFTGAIEI
jgi:hypothetical protein